MQAMLAHPSAQLVTDLALDPVESSDAVEIVALPFNVLWNRSAVVRSVVKTSKLIVFHQNGPDEAFATDVAATIGDLASEHLGAPIRVVAAAREDLASAVRSIAAY